MINVYYLLILVPVILIIICIIYYWKGKGKKKKRRISNIIQEEEEIVPFVQKNYEKYNEISQTYLVYDIDGEEHYLTWRYAGQNKNDKMSYNLVLLPYKNKQNEFDVHLRDHHYLKKIHEQNGIYDDSMKEKFQEQVFATSKYNANEEQYLELEKAGDEEYYVKASLWLEKGPFSYLHIDNRNKLYFDEGIHDNTVRFRIE